MKSILFTFTLLLCLGASAQTNYTQIYIWGISPDTAYIGDSIDIDFKFTPPVGANQIPYGLVRLLDGDTEFFTVWEDAWQKLYDFPKVPVSPIDSVYRMRVQVPSAAKPGPAKIYGQGGDNMSFYLKQKTVTGLTYHGIRGSDVVETRYFDLAGQVLSGPAGRYVRVDILSDGSLRSGQYAVVQ